MACENVRQVKTNDTGLSFAKENCVGNAPEAFVATGTLTLTGNAQDTETVTIGSVTYTFQDSLVDVDGNVHIGTDAAETITNLINAINNSGGNSGTDYAASNTEHPDVTAKKGEGDAAIITAKVGGYAGNLIDTTETLTNGSFDAAQLEGGEDLTWRQLEPNSIDSFSAEIETVARDPISKNRQRRKGTVTALSSGAEFGADLTMSAMDDFIEGFMFSRKIGVPTLPVTSITGGDTVNLPTTYTAEQAGFIQYAGSGAKSLFYLRGFASETNNGLYELAAAVGETDESVTFSGLTNETAPANAVIEIAGIRGSSDDLSMSRNNSELTITSAADIDFTTLGLGLGQFIHVGGLESANQFAGGTGFGRIIEINASTLVLDRIRDSRVTDGGSLLTFTSPDNGAGKSIDLLFGQFVRNVPVDDDDYLEQSYHIEATHPNLVGEGTDGYVYSIGNFANSLALTLNVADVATATFNFVGTDTEDPVSTRKTGADSAIQPVKTGAVNTSSDFARLIVLDADETGLTTDFDSMTITLNNGASPKNVLGRLGARFINPANFELDIETQFYFTDGRVPARIRNNDTVGMYFGLRNDDGAVFFDVPAMTLGDGSRDFPVDEAVLINVTAQAFADPILDTSLGVSFFPVVPSL